MLCGPPWLKKFVTHFTKDHCNEFATLRYFSAVCDVYLSFFPFSSKRENSIDGLSNWWFIRAQLKFALCWLSLFQTIAAAYIFFQPGSKWQIVKMVFGILFPIWCSSRNLSIHSAMMNELRFKWSRYLISPPSPTFCQLTLIGTHPLSTKHLNQIPRMGALTKPSALDD